MNQSHHEIYRAERLPVFQNLLFDTEEKARNCPKGDVVLVQDIQTGLIYNQAFNSDLVKYNTNYQNEQALSVSFQSHLAQVETILSCGRARSHILAGAKPAPEGPAIHRVASPWINGGNPCD